MADAGYMCYENLARRVSLLLSGLYVIRTTLRQRSAGSVYVGLCQSPFDWSPLAIEVTSAAVLGDVRGANGWCSFLSLCDYDCDCDDHSLRSQVL